MGYCIILWVFLFNLMYLWDKSLLMFVHFPLVFSLNYATAK